jgi:AraC family transcriptional regulator of adaptative response / DNA-3-methyladenine glycosylase II
MPHPLLQEHGLDPDACYAAIQSRDVRFDGQFFTAVASTGIYCRPSCPALVPRRRNVSFVRTPAAAQRAGYRACKRCRPDSAPGSAQWNLVADTAGRAIRLVEDGLVDREGVDGLAARLGFSTRQLRRHLVGELGAGPLTLARAHRAKTARLLLESTDLSAADVAFAAGFGSIRQCNETMQAIYAATPSELRERRSAPSTALRPADSYAQLDVRLSARRSADVQANLTFLGRHAIPGVEAFDGTTYVRSMRLPHAPAVVSLTADDCAVIARLDLGDLRDLSAAVARCRRMLDLDADPAAVDAHLSTDLVLGGLVARFPGRLLPGTHDGAETAIRTVLGQQISVAAARTTGAKLVALAGEPLPKAVSSVGYLFPTADAVAALDPAAIPIPRMRALALVNLAQELAAGLRLDPSVDRDETERQLLGLPGIGRWTAKYLRLRALADPDVLLDDDLVVRKSAASLGISLASDEQAGSRSWSPWNSYVTCLLWAAALTFTPAAKESS